VLTFLLGYPPPGSSPQRMHLRTTCCGWPRRNPLFLAGEGREAGQGDARGFISLPRWLDPTKAVPAQPRGGPVRSWTCPEQDVSRPGPSATTGAPYLPERKQLGLDRRSGDRREPAASSRSITRSTGSMLQRHHRVSLRTALRRTHSDRTGISSFTLKMV